jgi:spermidine synthase
VFQYGRTVNKGEISMTSLTYLKNKKFIGDLSLQDADVISEYASKSKSILEFGVGGSTQLLAQSNADLIISVDTSTDWIELTKKRLNQIGNTSPVQIMDYTTKFDTNFDLIFVDGVDNLRRQFAIETWQYLNTDGVMLFHDTRRLHDFQNTMSVAEQYFLEISKISVNVNASDGVSSNITILHKKQHAPYINWNWSEGKPLWAYALQYNEDMWSYNG